MIAQYEAQHLGIKHYDVPRKGATNRNDLPREVPREFLPVNEHGGPFVPLADYIVEEAISDTYMFDHFPTALAKLAKVNKRVYGKEVEQMALKDRSVRRAINRINAREVKSGEPTKDELKVLDNWYRPKDFDHPLCMLSLLRAWDTLANSTRIKNIDALRRILRKYRLRPLTK